MARVATPEGTILLRADEDYKAGEFIEILQDIRVTPIWHRTRRAERRPHPMKSPPARATPYLSKGTNALNKAWAGASASDLFAKMMVRCLNRVGQDFMTTMVAYELVRMRTLVKVRRRPPNAVKRHFSRLEQPLG